MVRVSLTVVVSLVVAGCGGSKSRPRTPGTAWLQKIEVDGNTAIEDDDLIPGLAIYRAHREGRAADLYQLSLDTKRIRGAYIRLGYFDAKVESKHVKDEATKAERVTFIVNEGKRSNALVVFSGLPPELPESVVRDRLELKSDGPFDYDLYDEGREVVKALVAEVGYPHVVDDSVVTVEKSAFRAVASYRIDAGPKAAFGPITIEGAEHPDLQRAIRGRLTVKEGDIYSPAALAETTRSLYELGRFSQVKIAVDTSEFAAVVPVQINVTRADNTELLTGFGFGYEPLIYETRVRGRFAYVPNEHPLQTWSVDGRAAVTSDHDFGNREPKVRLIFGFQRVEFRYPKLIADLSAGVDRFNVEAYTATGGLLRAGLRYPLVGRWLTAEVGWALSYLSFSDLSPVLTQNDADADGVIDPTCPDCDRDRRDLGLNEPELNGRYEQALVADLRDNQLEPRKGYYLALRITEGTIAAGGTLDYIMLQPDLRAYYPVWRFVLAGRLRGGTILGDVPVTQRFFSGGAQNHRGFSARTLSPPVRRFDNFGQLVGELPIGGQTFIEAGVEARTTLGELKGLPIGLTLFLDLGDVVFDNEELALDFSRPDLGLHAAAGAGVFVKLGGFKVRLDVGKRLNRLPVGIGGVVNDGLFENIEFFLAVGETY